MKTMKLIGLLTGSLVCWASFSQACYMPVEISQTQWTDDIGSTHTYSLFQYQANKTGIEKSWTEAVRWVEDTFSGETSNYYLATISSQAENEAVTNLLSNIYQGETFSGEAWLGGSRAGKKHAFTWATGEKFSYTNWNPGEPNSRSEFGLAMYLNSNQLGRWNDEGYLDNIHGFVVETVQVSTSAVPEPATMLLFGSGILGLSTMFRRKEN